MKQVRGNANMVNFQSLPLWTTALFCQDLLKTCREDTSNSLCEGLKRSIEQFLSPIINARKIPPISFAPLPVPV